MKLAGATDRANKIFLGFAAVFAVAVAITRVAIYEFDADHCKVCREYWPMPIYANGIRQAGFSRGTIVGATYDLAGNLRYQFPDSALSRPAIWPSVFGPDPGGQCLVIWEGLGDTPKATLDYLASALHAKLANAGSRGDVTARLINSKKRFDTMNYILLPNGICHDAP